MLVFKHPKYYEEMRRRAKREQELERKRASERAGGRVGPRAASRGASKQAIKRPMKTRASSVECDPNHSLRGKVFRGDRLEDRGSIYSRII